MPDILAVLRANTSDFSAKMAAAKAETDDLNKSGSSNMSKLSTVGGAALAGLAGAVVAVGAVSVDLGMKFQSTVASIANSAGISTSAAQKIGNAFLNTAGTTIFSGQQIATAYATVAGQLGATEGHALGTAQAMGVMRAAMDLAEASGTDLGTATTALAAVMQSYGEKANMAAIVSTTLYNGARMTGVGVDLLSTALDKAKTKLGGMAPPVEQMTGLLVDMAQHGETGRAAMSALTTSFTAFLKPASDVATAQANLHAATVALPPSLQTMAAAVQNGTMSYTAADKAAQALGFSQYSLMTKFLSASSAATTASQAQTKMGITAVDASGHMLPLGNIIGQLQTQIKGMGTAQAIAQLTADGFSGASAKLVGVIQAGPAAFQKATAAVAGTNTAHAAAEKQAATLKDQLETLKASAEDYATKLGVKLIPIIQKIVKFFMDHKDAAIALAAVIGGVLLFAIGAFVATTIAGMTAATAATGGITIALALLVAGGVYLATHWQQVWTDIKNWFNDALNFLRSGLGTFVVLLTGPLAPLIELGLHWQLVFGIVKQAVQDAWVVIKPIFDLVKDVIQTQLTVAITVFKALWQVAWAIIGGTISNVWGIISPIFNLIRSAGLDLIRTDAQILQSAWQAVFGAIGSAVSAVWGVIGPIFSSIINTGLLAIGLAINALQTAWNAVWGGISGAVSTAWGAISPIITDIKNAISDITGPLDKFIGDAKTAASIASNPVGAALHLFGAAAGGIVSQPTLLVAGESGPEAIIPLSGLATTGVQPLPNLGGGGGSGATAQVYVNITLDNAPFIQALQTAVLQYQRGTASPVFGASQTAAA